MLKRISDLSEAGTIAVSGHERPDGDCVGSVLALARYLQKAFPKARVDAILEEPPVSFQILDGIKDIKTEFNKNEIYDVFFALDCEEDRLGAARPLFARARRRINIDHHLSNQGCGDESVVDPDCSSTAELVYELMENKELLDAEIAKAIYIGIAHDTGVFRYSCTTPRTMRIAAELLEFGFDFSALLEETFFERTYLQTQIMGRAILESVRFMNNRCIVSMVTRRMMHFYQVTPADLDGIVSRLQGVKGVQCAIFMYETGTLEYKVSLRSDGSVNVAQVAAMFGGGGHVRAAGCTMNGTYHDNINNLSKEIAHQMRQAALHQAEFRHPEMQQE